jgi:hypothetical protein
MLFDPILESVNILSVLATAALAILTSKPCRASGVPYMLGIPAGFGLMTVAFAVQSIFPFLIQGLPQLGSPVEGVWLLTQTYGMLFIVFVYARRTRVRLLGESTSIDLLVAALVTLVFLVVVAVTQMNGAISTVSTSGALFLRVLIIGASAFLGYETFRNWGLTQKASQGIVTIGFAFFIVEQIGFILATWNLGPVALFIAYEGRLMGLFVLIIILIVGVKKNDPIAIMKRLGLVAPVHARAPELLTR